MNLKEFINHRQYCPLCCAPLTIMFHKRKQSVEIWDNNRLSVVFTLLPYKVGTTQKTYVAKYVFDLLSCQFHIEFYTRGYEHFSDVVPLGIINLFRELHTNLGSFVIYRNCPECAKYQYASYKFDLILGQPVPPIEFRDEVYCLHHKIDEQYTRAYQLINNPFTQKTMFGYWKEDNRNESYNYAYERNNNITYLNIPLIPFVSKQETVDRLNNLIIFT